MKDFIKRILILLTTITAATGCEWLCPDDKCIVDEENRKVLLLYSAGYNSLRNYLLDDIRDLKQGWLPGNECNDDILLVYTHSPRRSGSYNEPTSPYLIRLYRNQEGATVSDTLQTYEKGTISSSAAQMKEVLTYIKDNFTSGSYGMIFSSHATGYLPSGYYSDPDSYTFAKARPFSVEEDPSAPSPVPYIEPEYDPSLPMVKSIGQDVSGVADRRVSYEMDLPDFAEAIPMQLDYILFDACLMGGVEVAYELKDKCRKVGFSQAEVLAEGLDYKTLTSRLLEKDIPDVEGVCDDYFTQYETQSGVYRSATISLIDCEKIDPLASVCKELFAKYREGIASADPAHVQRFYRYDKHWFYDLESILTEAGADSADMDRLHEALDQCVIYKGHTPEFMNEFKIKTFSGFSMYLPVYGEEELDMFYRTLKWNEVSGLVI